MQRTELRFVDSYFSFLLFSHPNLQVVKDHPWVDVDDWESTQQSFVSFVNVVKHYGTSLAEKMKFIKVYKLMGADLLLR